MDENEKRFIDSLPLLQNDYLNSFEESVLSLADIGKAIAYYKYRLLSIQIYYGAVSLCQAHQKAQVDVIGRSLSSPILQRAMYLENAYNHYNTCLDYIYSIFYFNNHLYGEKEFSTFAEVENESEKIKKNVINKVWDSIKSNQDEFYEKFKMFKTEAERIREIDNRIKHRATYCLYSLHDWITASKGNVNLNDIVVPTVTDVEESIDNLAQFHRKTFDIQKELFVTLEFNKICKEFLKPFAKENELDERYESNE